MLKKSVSKILFLFFTFVSKKSGPNAFYINKIIDDANFTIGKGAGGPNSLDFEIKSVSKILKSESSPLIIDAGTHEGSYTDIILDIFPNSTVHCFEPSSKNFEYLSKKYSGKNNIFLNNIGLDISEGYKNLYSDFSGSSLASLNKRKMEHFNRDFKYSEKIKTTTFDNYWENILDKKAVDLLKLDVEGAELSVLEGCYNSIKYIKNIQFEFGGANIDSRTFFQDFWYFFQSKEFELFRITPFGLIEINNYSEQDEFFKTTNYIARNLNLS